MSITRKRAIIATVIAFVVAAVIAATVSKSASADGTGHQSAQQQQDHAKHNIKTGRIVISQSDGGGKYRVVRRTTGRVFRVTNGWDFDAVSSFHWRGQRSIGKYYDWAPGVRPRSAFSHWRKGDFENCWIWCAGEWYPTNLIKVHSNGTYYVQGKGL
jgi:hypothetical protein